MLTLRRLSVVVAAALLAGCSTTPTTSRSHDGIAAGTSRAELAAGNGRFLSGGMDAHSWHQERVVKTGTFGQSPSIGVLSCADSRVPPEVIFDQGVGDLFVVRIAGNFVNDAAVGSFEFGVQGLGVHTILVMGHTKCGAVNAAVTNAQLPGDMPVFTAAIRPAVAQFARPEGEKVDLLAAEEANVRWQMKQLLDRSEILRTAQANGSLTMLAAMYDVETGRVRFLD